MTPAVVVDVGNSRIKWGRCIDGPVVEAASLPPDDPTAWLAQMERWGIVAPAGWVLTGVHPQRRDHLGDWLRRQGHAVRLLDDPKELPLRVLLERPDHVGVDRLLDAVAANSRRRGGTPAVVVDAGSAVTVDLVDAAGAFAGGVIMPGFRLMAQALHDYTALLPLVPPPTRPPDVPGVSTPKAVEAGVYYSVVGGIRALIGEYAKALGATPQLFLTGGDGPLLGQVLTEAEQWPLMTLEGIRLAAEALP
jgi:type III pantothenate kinase